MMATATTTATDLNYASIAASVDIADDDEMPAPIRRTPKDNAFIPVVAQAAKDHKRRVLKGRYSLLPFEGRKGACEAFAVMSQLHRAARTLNVKVSMRRYDVHDDTCKITFKIN